MYNALSRASVVIQLQQDVEQYEATVVSTNGVILQPYDTSTTLIGSVLKNKEDITDKIKDIRWTKWNPSADNLIECPEWNRTHKGSHIIEVSKADVDSKSIFTFEAYNTKGELLCTASISIIDINDLLVNTEKPLNPYPGQLWIDERTEPATLYVWNGYKWVIVGSVGTVVKNLLRNTAFLFNTDYWNIVGDTRLSFSPYGVDYLGHRFLKMASGVLTEEHRGIAQTTEDIIGTGAEYSFQMLYYSKEDTQTYSNNIKVNIYSVNSYGDETLITTKTVQAKPDIKRLFFVFETRLDTKDIKVEILGEEGHRYNFFVGEIALYNTANDYPWTMHPLDLQLYGYSQEELWNILSNNGKIQGIFTRVNPETGQLEYYINATYIGAGKMKAEYLDAYNLRVLRKDDDVTTLEITENGDVNLRVNTLIINSANKTIEDIVSQIYMDQNRIELKVENYKDELSSRITQTAEEIRLEVKNTKEELESSITQTAEAIRLEVKNTKDELESSITQTAEEIKLEVKNTKDQLESSITQTATEIRAEVKDVADGLSSTISQTASEIRAEVKDVNDNLTSTITQTASQIRAEVSDMDERLTSSITQTADSIRSEVSDLDEKLTSSITQTADSIRSEVSDMDERLTSSITQTATDIRSEVSDLDERLTSSITQTATDIRSEVSELDKKVSSVTQTADQIKAEIKDLDENLTSTITQTAKDIRSEVNDLDERLTSSITQTAKDIRSEVSDLNNNLTSSITQTAKDIRSEVKDINDNLTSSITQTASDIRSEVSDLDKNLSSKIDQTAKDINLKVEDNSKNISSLIDITAEGIYLDSNGSLVNINGDGVIVKAANVEVNATNIHLEGYTTINQGFSVDKDGNMTANNGKFNGAISSSTVTGSTINGGKIIGTVIQNAETNPTFSVSAEGIITGAAVRGGSIGIGGSNYDAFTVDGNGNCNITKGSISIGGNFVVGTNGVLTATGANFTGSINAGSSITGTNISGGTITGTTIKNTNNTFSIDDNGNISGGSITIGDNFKVTNDGKLTAKSANITGIITATDGKIGGYTIGEYKLTANNIGMCSNSGVEWAFWAGSNAGGDAPFHVGHDGSLYATNAHISGGTVSSSLLIGTIDNARLNSSIVTGANDGSSAKATLDSKTSDWDNALNRVRDWAAEDINGYTTINGGLIQTGTITAKHLYLGDLTNYCNLIDQTASLYGFTAEPDNWGTWFRLNNNQRDTCISGNGIDGYRCYKCNGGESFRIKYQMKSNVVADNGYCKVNIGCYGMLGNGNPFWSLCDGGMSDANSTERYISTTIKIPDDARTFGVYLQLNGNSGWGGTCRIKNVQVMKMSSGELIVDGAITAEKLDVKDLSALNATIGGFHIYNGKLVGYGGQGVGMSGNGDDWAFWAGSNTGGSAPFHVGHDGSLYATNATITGAIASSTISGSTISGNSITGGTITGTHIEGNTINGGTINSTELIGVTIRNADNTFSVLPSGDITGASVTSVNKSSEGTVVGYASYSPEGMEIYATNADKPTAYFTTAGSYVDNLRVDELYYYPMVRQANRNGVPSTFYVSDQATGDGSGRDENNYCDSIQDIIQSIWTDYGQVLCKNITIVVKSGSKITDDISIRGFGGWSDLTIKWEYNTQFWGTILVADNTIRVNFIGQTDGTDITFDPKTDLTEMRRRARFYTTPGQNGINVRNAYFSIQNFVALCNRSSGYDESYFISYNYGARGYVTCMDINNYKYAIYSGRGSTAGITNCCGDVKYYYYGAGGGIIVSGRRVPACSSGALTGESDGMVFFHTNYSPIMYTSMYKYGTYSYKNSSGNTGDGSTGEVPVTKTTYTKTIALTNLRTTVSGSGATTSGKSGITGQGKWGNYKLHTGHATIPSSILNTLKAGNCTINNAYLIVTRQNTSHGYTGEVPYPVIDLGGARQSASGYKIAQGGTKTIPLNNDIKSALKSGASDLRFVGEGYSQYMFCSSVKLKVNYTITG